MQHADEALLSVVVLEARAAWPPWLGEYQQRAPNSVVLAQASEEPGARFAQRILHRMNTVAASDTKIHVALLVCNGELDTETITTRQQLCQLLLGAMVGKHHGELVLAAEAMASDELRHELFSLAGILCDNVRGTPVAVRVRFGSIRPGSSRATASLSGVMTSVTAPPVLPEGENENDAVPAAAERFAQNGRD